MKQKLVNDIFSSVANKYDLMNDLMSFGTHRLWKREMMKLLPDKSKSLLDIAGGSGDIAYSYLKQAQEKHEQPSVTLCDINFEMLLVARDRLIDRGQVGGIDLVAGDAACLPLQDNIFDYCTIVFGIRNVANIRDALKEAYRVLKPGGKFVCMEFSPPSGGMTHKLYDLYSFNIIPKMGKLITGNQEAYEYLVESIRQFPPKEEFLGMINKSGFKSARYKTLSFGIVAIHYGYKKAVSDV